MGVSALHDVGVRNYRAGREDQDADCRQCAQKEITPLSAMLVAEHSAMLSEEGAMPEEKDQTNDQNQTNDAGGRDDVQTLEQALRLISALEKRVSERDENVKSYQERLNAIEADRKKTLAEQGNYQQLLSEANAQIEALKGAQERMSSLEAIIREGNKQRIERIPEQMRGLVPTEYSPEKLQTWLNNNEATLVKPPAPKYGAGEGAGAPTGGNEIEVTDKDRRASEIARAHGRDISPETIAKRRIEQTENK